MTWVPLTFERERERESGKLRSSLAINFPSPWLQQSFEQILSSCEHPWWYVNLGVASCAMMSVDFSFLYDYKKNTSGNLKRKKESVLYKVLLTKMKMEFVFALLLNA